MAAGVGAWHSVRLGVHRRVRRRLGRRVLLRGRGLGRGLGLLRRQRLGLGAFQRRGLGGLLLGRILALCFFQALRVLGPRASFRLLRGLRQSNTLGLLRRFIFIILAHRGHEGAS